MAIAEINRRIRKVLVVIVLIAFLGSYIPQKQQVYAITTPQETATSEETQVDIPDYPTTTDPDFDPSKVDIESEITSERTATSKVFRKIDGTYEIALYNDVVHYFKEGKWEQVDNSLLDTGEELENAANLFEVKFPKTIDCNKQIKLEIDDYAIDWTVLNVDTSAIEYTNNTKDSDDSRELTNINQIVLYSNVQPNVDIEYTLTGSGVKENIILNKYISNFSMSFEYKLKNLSLIENEKGEIVFVNEDNGLVSSFSDLMMNDSNLNESSNLSYQLTDTGNKSYRITIIPNDAWLQNAKYPVRIDPTLTFYGDSDMITDKYVYGAYSSASTAPYNKVGLLGSYHYRSYLEFDLTQIPEDIMVNYAFLHINTYPNSNYCTSECTIIAKEVDSSYDLSDITGENMNITDDRIIDYEEILYADGDGKTYYWDITKNFQKWIFNGDTSRVIELRKLIESKTGYIYLKSENFSITTGPVLVIGYDYTNGLRDYWTYNVQPISTAGTGYVSDYTGNLTLVRNDISFGTEKQSLSLSLVYNINDRLTNIGYGAGWRTNYNIEARWDSENSKYYSIDATGAKTYYVETANDSRFQDNVVDNYTSYLAEDGSRNLFITYQEQGETEILDYFIVTLEQVQYHFGYDGYLDTIYDKKTDTTTYIDYDIVGNNIQIDIITDSTGNYIDLIYNGYDDLLYAYLYVKTGDPNNPYDLLEKTYYTYFPENGVGDYVPRYVYYYKDYMDNESLPLDNYVYYDHDPYGRLLIAQSSLGSKVIYTYNTSTDKVSNIKSYIDSSKIGEVSYGYDYKNTTITDQDGKEAYYWFDNYGHTVQIMTNDGFVQTYKYLNIFSPSSNFDTYIDINGTRNYRLNHIIIFESTPEFAFFDPVLNGGFEEYSSATSDPNWDFVVDDYNGYSPTFISNEYSEDECIFGLKSAYANVYFGQDVHYEQNIILDSGTYNLSGYVKLSGANSSSYMTVSGYQTSFDPENIEYINPDEEWHYVSLPFTVSNDNTTVTIKFNRDDGGSGGSVYFDSIQLLEGYRNTRTNLMENSSFENTLNGWTMSSGSAFKSNSTAYATGVYEDILGDYSIQINGNNETTESAYYDITSKLDLTSENVYTIKVWSKSSGTPMKIWDSANERIYRLRIEYTIASEIISDVINFDSSQDEWQQMSKAIFMNQNVTNVKIYLEYKGLGFVLFDGITIEAGLAGKYAEVSASGNIAKVVKSNFEEIHYAYLVDEEGQDTEKPLDSRAILIESETSQTDTPLDSYGRPQYFENNNVRITPSYNSNGQVSQLFFGDVSNFFTTSTVYSSGKFNQYKQSTTDEFGNSTIYDYDIITGLLQSITNANNATFDYEYYDNGLLNKVLNNDYCDPDNPSVCAVTEYVYDSDNMLIKIILSTGYYYQITYNAQNRMAGVYIKNDNISYSNELMTYTYLYENNVYTSKIDIQTYGNDDFIKFLYDNNDRISAIQYNNSLGVAKTRFSYEYDQLGRVAVFNTHEGNDETIIHTEYYTYDISGKMTAISDNEGNSINYGYDGSGNLIDLDFSINNESQETLYFYNKFLDYYGSEDDLQSSLYDKTTYTTQDSNEVTKEYFYENNALYKLDYIRLTIDALNIKQDFVFSGNTTRISQITYDISENGIDYKYSYSYDELGNITEVIYYEGTTLIAKDNYTYDELNQLVIEDVYKSNDEDDCIASEFCYTNVYTYDLRGNIIKKATYDYGTTENGPDFIWENSSTVNVNMRYNGYNSYDDIYYLDLYESPSLTFVYYNPETGVPYTSVRTRQMYSNLNTSIPGYYYRDYWASSLVGINILFRIVFVVGDAAPLDADKMISYEYSEDWLDQLASYDIIFYGTPASHNFTYDAQGNPITIDNFAFNGTEYDHANLEWDGRQLSSISILNEYDVEVHAISYAYNDSGYRTSKTIDSETVCYTLIDDKVIYETNGTYAITFTYDYDGKIISFSYDPNINVSNDEAEYFYLRNQQGDITHILDASGNTIVKYRYDAYGNIIDIQDTSQNDIVSSINPYTYRGYRFDSEIRMYYLNSRYYVPEIGRFLNSDGLLGQIGDLQSTNMYAYCANNPVMHTDSTGYWFGLDDAIAFLVGGVAGVVGQLISDVIKLAITGEWQGTWESYVGSFIGYGIGAVSTLYLGPAAGFAIGGGLSTFASQGLEKWTGSDDRTWGEILLNTGVSAGIGAIFGGLTKGLKIQGITAGRNSWSAIFKSGLTKIANGNAAQMSFSVMMRGLGATIVSRQIIGNVGKGLYNGLVEWYEYFASGDTEGLSWVN